MITTLYYEEKQKVRSWKWSDRRFALIFTHITCSVWLVAQLVASLISEHPAVLQSPKSISSAMLMLRQCILGTVCNDCGWLLLSYAKLYVQSNWAARSRLRFLFTEMLCLVLPSNFGVAARACWNSVHAGLIMKLSLKRLGEWSVRQLKIDQLLVWKCT